jgi:hypothetical protein
MRPARSRVPSARHRPRGALLLLLGAACSTGGAAAPVTPGPTASVADEGAAWLAGRYPADLAGGTHAIGVARGPTPDAARAAARARLEASLGAPTPPEVTWPALVERTAPGPGEPVLLLALDRAALAAEAQAAVDALPLAMVSPALPPPERLAAHRARLDALDTHDRLCAYLAQVGGAPCTPRDHSVDEDGLRALGRLLLLAPALPAGIPFVPGQVPLRPLELRATTRDEARRPWPGLPLVLPEAPAGALALTRAVTDPAGRSTFPFAAPVPAPSALVVAVDRTAALGPGREALWPAVSVAVPLRPLHAATARLLVDLEERVDERPAARPVARTELCADLTRRGLALASVPGRTPASLTALLEQTGGGVDVLVRGSVRTAFASRLASRTVWYEATAAVEVIDAWTGKRLAQIEERAQDAGVGDEHAAEKSAAKLSAALAERVARVVAEHLPPP